MINLLGILSLGPQYRKVHIKGGYQVLCGFLQHIEQLDTINVCSQILTAIFSDLPSFKHVMYMKNDSVYNFTSEISLDHHTKVGVT